MRAIMSIALVSAVAGGCHSASPAMPEPADAPAATPDYHAIAAALRDRIAALRAEHSSLAELRIVQDGLPDSIRVRFTCRHGIREQRCNPDWTPESKVEQFLPVFADDGVELDLYIHRGRHPGATAMRKIAVVEDLNVSLFVRGPKAEEVRAKIEEVIALFRN